MKYKVSAWMLLPTSFEDEEFEVENLDDLHEMVFDRLRFEFEDHLELEAWEMEKEVVE